MGGVVGFPKQKEGRDESILLPQMPIIDAHHHLLHRPGLSYLLDDYLGDAGAGHKVVASVYVEAHTMARPDGDARLRPVGEVEFANGVGAICASGVYGDCRVAAAIVGFAEMTRGEDVAMTLDAAMSRAPDRFRGVRQIALEGSDPETLRFLLNKPAPGFLESDAFLLALGELAKRDLSFDATVFHHQLPALGRAAAACGDAKIILDHMGLALARGKSLEARAAAFGEWRENMIALARQPNIFCKLGGLGTSYWGFDFYLSDAPATSEHLAEVWKPYVMSAIEAFGVDRCMMSSNFPNDGRSSGFVPLWNAMKRIVRDLSLAEQEALFWRTASQAYRMAVSGLCEPDGAARSSEGNVVS